MKKRFGGWWRLWFAISGVWIALAMGVGITLIVGTQSATSRMKSDVGYACRGYGSPAHDWTDLSIEQLQAMTKPKSTLPPPPPGYRLQSEATATQGGGRFGGIPIDQSSERLTLSKVEDIGRCINAKQRDYVGEASKDRRGVLIGTVLGAISTPLILLLLGILTGWVIRGFRNSKTQQ